MANRLAMPRGILRSRCSVGTMRDEPAALRGEAADLVTTRGFYAFDGPRGRYDLVFSVEDMSKNYVQTGPTMSSSVLPVMSQRLATDGTKTLFDLISLTADRKALGHSFNLDTGVDQFHRNKLMIPSNWGRRRSAPALRPTSTRPSNPTRAATWSPSMSGPTRTASPSKCSPSRPTGSIGSTPSTSRGARSLARSGRRVWTQTPSKSLSRKGGRCVG